MPMYQHKTLYILAILWAAEFSAKRGGGGQARKRWPRFSIPS